MDKNEKTDIVPQQEEQQLYEDLRPKDLERWNLAPGDIHWKKSNGKLVKLYGAGEYLDKAKLQTFFDRKTHLTYDLRGSHEDRQQIELALHRYLSAAVEDEKLKYRRQLLGLIKSLYWVPSKSSLIDLVLVFDKFFNKWPEHEPKFLTQSPDVHKRNALIGTLNALGGIILSYNHVHYLQDLFNVVFLVDISYQKTMTAKIFKLIDCERIGDKVFNAAFDSLSGPQKEGFHAHALSDFEVTKKNYADLFTYPSTLLFLKRHHEKVSGIGMPLGVTQEEVSDIELWGMVVSRVFQIDKLIYQNGDGDQALFKTLNLNYRQDSKNKDYIGRRISMLINSVMENLTPVRNIA